MASWMGPSKSDFDCSMRHRRSDVLPMAKESIGDDAYTPTATNHSA